MKILKAKVANARFQVPSPRKYYHEISLPPLRATHWPALSVDQDTRPIKNNRETGDTCRGITQIPPAHDSDVKGGILRQLFGANFY